MGGSYVDVSIESENKDDISTPCEQLLARRVGGGVTFMKLMLISTQL